jgi:hypothetical protein
MDDVLSNHLPRATVDELLRLLELCERALPSLPPAPRDYFEALRSMIAESLRLAKRLRPWHFDDRLTTA